MLCRIALLLSLISGASLAQPPDSDQRAGPSPVAPAVSETPSEATIQADKHRSQNHPPPAQSSPHRDGPPRQANTTAQQTVIEFLDAIESHEAESGAYDQGMGELLNGLGTALQQEGKHLEAVKAFQRSMHVNRVNNGIYSTTQEPMLRSMIESHNELANLNQVALHYGQLLWLYEKSYGTSSPELIPLLEETSNWHRDMYLNVQSRDTVGHLILSVSLAGSAVDIASQHFGSTHLQLVELLRDMAESSYYLASHYSRYHSLEPQDNNSFNVKTSGSFSRLSSVSSNANTFANEERLWQDSYNSGRSAYERIVAILNNSDATPQQRAAALVELGDWFVLFKRRSSALDAYAQAWQALSDEGDQEMLSKLLGKPVRLPDFQRQGSSPPAQRLAKVTMDISKAGRARNIDVQETYPIDDDSVARIARKILRNSIFRARYENGEPVATKGYELNLYIRD